MLKLPDVTLFAIDCVTPQRTLAAMEFSTRWVKFSEVLLLTDTRKFPQLPQELGYRVPLKVAHHEQSDRRAERPGAPYHPSLPLDYELARMREPALHIQTSHYLAIEWDSAVLNRAAWQPEWLQWDFIGAPWCPHQEPGYPFCDGQTNAVGNAGFSLQSLRYARAVREMTDTFKDDPQLISSDMYPCHTARHWLEETHGIRFAPVTVAERFSCENQIYSGQFGFHGRWTAQMNNWGGDFLGGIRPNQAMDLAKGEPRENL